jgi:sirohydrochlorin ferrochelatase
MASATTAVTPRPRAAGTPAFILATDLNQGEPAWRKAEAHAQGVASACAQVLGFDPVVRLANAESIAQLIVRETADGANEIFVLPVALDFHLFQREAIGQALGEARRRHPEVAFHHDDVDPGHPLLVECLADQVARALGPVAPQHAGLILAASGHGDAGSRAQSYRLMRLVWERLGLAVGDVGFLRHVQPFLLVTLERCVQRQLDWVILPEAQWRTEHVEYTEIILGDFQRGHPEAGEWRMAEPPDDHPAITAWLAQRITRLWNEKRAREAVRIASPKTSEAKPEFRRIGAGIIASAPDRPSMAEVLEHILPACRPERVLVKVTWHGYATGTYTDPAALDLLLGALPARAVILEGHTSSRNLEDAAFDWETQAKANRAWIRQQDAEYLRRTGLAGVLARHGAEYLNVTEAFWDEACVAPERVREILGERGVSLHHTELTEFIPETLLAYRGCPMISFAKFKGPTRLAVSNLFGLIPEPLRTAWHGPNLTYLARVCCDLAKLYGALFDLSGLNEALYTAVRWNRHGLYRSRWGNYDLISNSGYVAASRDLVTADILASRLQGQDVNRSAFFDVLRAELGWDEPAATHPLPPVTQHFFA